MKQFFKMFFASFLALIIGGLILLFITLGAVNSLLSDKKTASEESGKSSSGQVLTLDLSRTYHEQGETNALAKFSEEQEAYSAGLEDISAALKAAAADARVKGLLIRLAPSPNGLATLQQIRNAVARFRDAHKFVYAYGENITQGAYFVGTAGDSIFLNPSGDFELKGLASTIPFFKEAFDKLDLQPEIFYAGKFKSATEPFRAYKISDPNRLQMSSMQNSMWSQFLAAAAEFTRLDTATIHQLTVTGAVQFPADGVKYKLISGLKYLDEVEDLIRARTGQKAGEKINYVSVDNYAGTVRQNAPIKNARIAVLNAEGSIVDGDKTQDYEIASRDMIKVIRKLRDNDKIKAVVLRVNSPGGSALASEVILRELNLLKAKKPLIVSMGEYAASGGYYISSGADSIFALPTTLTGSIGVFGMMFNISGVLKNKVGITFDGVKNAPYADFPTMTRALTPEEALRMQASVDTVYHQFKSRVAAGRKMDIAIVDSIAQGRVWTGAQALEIGLVDALGDVDRAIQSAAAKANISDYQVVYYPDPVDKMETLIRKLSGQGMVPGASVKAYLKSEVGEEYEYIEAIGKFRKMSGKAMMLLPYRFTFQ